ncbi:BtrH N-terminal domain-containing protein [Aliarcobacter butzleri]|uniref:BtrH N-terminal domain-containing protein n=1 Tax=Aliarcobacter butzleri TaxID=28197 RepID=UPI001EDD4D0B|nr:BtrH N-terminal domain-containing protein [Aliarcobacter butzleri]MCG3680915.1 BtrH N-terminal domain-containing protein [Aliarcobacter butzleri]MCR8710267.1 BtrH N-terminal domain-containing protein [Aliarcobacter butzleri]
MNKEFRHSQFAHCESGVLSSMLTNYGLSISEPMVFGLTNSLTFAFFPVIKVNNMPLIAYRAIPKNIIKNVEKVLKIKMYKKSYKNIIEANLELTKLVENEKKLVGLQTSVFYLPYMPENMRFHFNAHNLLVYGKEGNIYKISDPVFEDVVECNQKELTKARFAKGVFAPKGFLYYPLEIPKNIDFTNVLKKSIRKNAKSMLTPFPFAGVNGMKKLAKAILKLENKDERYIKNYLTHIVRMQEEIGTGGGGFRYLYAAFLQEAKEYSLDNEKLDKAIFLITSSGDTLREFALKCVESAKKLERFNPKDITNILIKASELEKEAFKILKTI